MAVSARLTFLEEYGGNVEVIQVLSWFDLNFVSFFTVINQYHLCFQGRPREFSSGGTEPVRQQAILLRVYAGESVSLSFENV